jgi:acyl carrier protein
VSPTGTVTATPASYAQQRLWYLHQLTPDRATYAISGGVDLEGSLDPVELIWCIDQSLCRHEVLRSHFAMVNGELLQITRSTPAAARLIDLRQLLAKSDVEAVRTVVDDLARQEANAPFELGRGPLVRVTVLRTRDHTHTLLMSLHHIIADAWSLDLLVREVVTTLNRRRAGLWSSTPPPALQYADFAAWQRSLAETGALDGHRAFWRDELDGARFLVLPTDRPRGTDEVYRGASLYVTVDDSTTAALRRLVRSEGATLLIGLLATFFATLYQLTGRSDLVLGSSVAGRARPETQDMIGLFVNMVAIRTRIDAADSLATVVQRTAWACAGAYDHQELPFEQVVDLLGQPRVAGRHPLFAALFQLIPPAEPVDIPGLDVRYRPTHNRTSQLDLVVSISAEDARLNVTIDYRADLYDEPTVAGLIDSWLALMRELVEDPHRPLGHVEATGDAVAGDAAVTTAGLAELPEAVFVAPRTELETGLQHLWVQVLGHSEVGVRSNFFRLGGHSLQATALLSIVQTTYGVQVDLGAFLAAPTIEALAESIEKARSSAVDLAELESVLAALEEQPGSGRTTGGVSD